jgi:hypothetical protein
VVRPRAPPRARGGGALFDLVGNAVPVARSYELQSFERQRKDASSAFLAEQRPGRGDQNLVVIDRFSPIVGETMFSFGAFLLTEYRHWDFYAGVYDGLVNLACFEAQRAHQPCTRAALRDRLARLAAQQRLEDDVDARLVIDALYAAEFGDVTGDPDAVVTQQALERARIKFPWRTRTTQKPDVLLKAVASAMISLIHDDEAALRDVPVVPRGADDCPVLEQPLDPDCRLARIAARVASIDGVSEALRGRRAVAVQQHDEQRRRELDGAIEFLAVDGWNGWFLREARDVVGRVNQLQQRDVQQAQRVGQPSSGAANVRRGAIVAEALLRSQAIVETEWGFVTGSTFPNTWGQLLAPHRVAFGVGSPAFDVAWRPTLAKTWSRLGFTVDAVATGYPLEKVGAHAWGTAAIWVVPAAGVALELHAGPSWRPILNGAPWGVDGGIDLVALHKLRLGFGVRHQPAAANFARQTPELLWTLGVDDVSALTGWACALMGADH